MLFVSAGGSKAPADVISIGDADGALGFSLAKFELRRAHCYDPNEVGGRRWPFWSPIPVVL